MTAYILLVAASIADPAVYLSSWRRHLRMPAFSQSFAINLRGSLTVPPLTERNIKPVAPYLFCCIRKTSLASLQSGTSLESPDLLSRKKSVLCLKFISSISPARASPRRIPVKARSIIRLRVSRGSKTISSLSTRIKEENSSGSSVFRKDAGSL
ncbi:Uncharacterised protein [Enterobacter hormaechei]|nr:Uncharacterised protein [Enterobacter hormaechei]VAG44807.1 Uncharacterised protein [Enterobacter hormaechei]